MASAPEPALKIKPQVPQGSSQRRTVRRKIAAISLTLQAHETLANRQAQEERGIHLDFVLNFADELRRRVPPAKHGLIFYLRLLVLTSAI